MPKLSRNGNALFYDEKGMGDPAILFVHGAMNDSSYFAKQIEFFSPKHRTIAVDLCGHGMSDKPQQEYTIPGFADDLAWLCSELGVTKPIIVGHSMGGMVALELAAKYPDLPSAIVLLDSPVVSPPPFAGAMQQYADAVQTPEYGDAIRQFTGQFVGFGDDPGQKERILNGMASVPQHVAASVLKNNLVWDSEKAAAACTVPLLYVSSGPWFTDVTRFRELLPQLITGQTVGSGHYHQLEVPEQINAMIERFISVGTS